MEIKRVTVEYDEATYVAEGNDARTWRAWMLEAEEVMRRHAVDGRIWNSWTRVETSLGPTGASKTMDGPAEP